MAAVHQSPCKSLQYIHSNFKGYLHNDLKLDNIVIGNTVNRKLKPYTFGKVYMCPIKNGKKYFRRDTEKEVYETEHPQVAPELCDGLVEQSISTESDVYSLGRIMKRCNSVMLHSSKF